MPVTLSREDVLTVTLTLEDKGSKGYMQFHIGENTGALPDTSDAAFLAYLSELVDNVEGMSDCRVTSIACNLGYRITGNAAFGDSPNVERKAVFQFDTAAGFPAIVTVPGVSNACLAEDGKNLKRTGTTFEGTMAAALQGVHDKLQNGVTIGLVTFPVTDRRGSDFNGLIDAYQQHRRSSRG